MKLLLDTRNKIVAIGSSIEFGVWGNVADASSWKIDETEFTMDSNYSLVDIMDAEIPTYVEVGAYYYIDGKFRLADECPNEYKDRIITLEENASVYEEDLLNTQLALTEQYEANLVLEEDLVNTQLALVDQYETNLLLEENLATTQAELLSAQAEITDLQLAICELYESMI